MVAGIEASKQAYDTSQWIVIAFRARQHRAGAGPRLCHLVVADRTGQGDRSAAQARSRPATFTQRVHVVNRDELGALAANVNRMCEELGTPLSAARIGQPEQVAVPRQYEPRAAHAAQRHHRLHRDDGRQRYGEMPEKARSRSSACSAMAGICSA